MCLGRTHSLQGLAVGVATLPYAPVPNTITEHIAWVAAVGGMAMLPDLDQRGTTIARMWGPVSETAAGVVGWVARGHRWGTHDLALAPVALGGLAFAAALYGPTRLTVLAVALGLALRALAPAIPGRAETTILGNLAASWVGAWWLTRYEPLAATSWLPWAVALGVIVHCLGDAPTEEGLPVPLLWITHRWRMPLPWRLGFETGHWFERRVVFPATAAALVLALGWNAGLGTYATHYARTKGWT